MWKMQPRQKRSANRWRSRCQQQSTSNEPQPQAPPPPTGPSDRALTLRAGLANKSLVAERGMKYQANKQEWVRYRDTITEYGWWRFVEPPMQSHPSIVREFYANLPDRTQDGVVTVFGVPVQFGARAINDHYFLENREENDDMWHYYADFSHSLPYGKIEHVLSLGKGLTMINWDSRTVQANSLCNEAKIWRRFLQRRVFGIKNETDVTLLQQRFLYLMVTGAKVDVGRYIWSRMCAKGDKLKNGQVPGQFALSYPSIITEMCINAGVQVPESDYQQVRIPHITSHTIGVDNNPTLREFFIERWGGEGTPGWERPKIARPPGNDEIHRRQMMEAAHNRVYRGDPEDEPIPQEQPTTENVPDSSIPHDESMPQAPPSYSEQAGPSGTAGTSRSWPPEDYDFWSQPGWQSYIGQQESQWMQIQRRFDSLEHQVENLRQSNAEYEEKRRSDYYDQEQRNIRNMQRQDEFLLQMHMQRMNLTRDEAPRPPTYEWPPSYDPPQ